MALFRWLAVGTLGYVAYRAWQRQVERRILDDGLDEDEGERTPPHGDPVLVGETLEVAPAPVMGVQTSRGFGDGGMG